MAMYDLIVQQRVCSRNKNRGYKKIHLKHKET